MPRHIHKPRATKNTATALQELKTARERTQTIKADLIEHNNVIKLHADQQLEAKADAEAKEDEMPEVKNEAPAFTPKTAFQDHLKEEPKARSEKSKAEAAEPIAKGFESLFAGSSPVSLDKLFSIQLEMLNMQFSAWKSFMAMCMNPASVKESPDNVS